MNNISSASTSTSTIGINSSKLLKYQLSKNKLYTSQTSFIKLLHPLNQPLTTTIIKSRKYKSICKHNNYENVQIHQHHHDHSSYSHHSCNHVHHLKNELLNSNLKNILTFGHELEENPISLILSIIGLSLNYIPSIYLNQWTKVIGIYIVFICSGFPLLLSSIAQIIKKNIDAHVLMCLAALASIYLGMATEGALLLVLFHISHSLEHKFSDEAHLSLKNLLENIPEYTTTINMNSNNMPDFNSITVIPVVKVSYNSYILIKAGEQVPLDGYVVYGSSDLTVQHISGESLPVSVKKGYRIIAGSRNLNGMIIIKTISIKNDSTPAKIAKIAYEAKMNKPKVHKWIEHVTAFWSQCVLCVALLTLIVLVIYGLPFLGNKGALYRSLGLLTAAAPCALILVPLAYVCALATLSKKGILVRAASIMDTLLTCHNIALDKTGTLTSGKLIFKDIHFSSHGENELKRRRAIHLASLLSRGTEHPIAMAILDISNFKNDEFNFKINNYKHISGSGIMADLSDEKKIKIALGSPLFIKSLFKNNLSIKLKELMEVSEKVNGAKALFIEKNEKDELLEWCIFEFEDKIIEKSEEAIKKLKNGSWDTGNKNKSKIKNLTILTGDNEKSTLIVSNVLKIKDIHVELKPEEKFNFIKKSQENGKWMMVGDGMNDAPALAQADIGIAISDTENAFSATTADIVILNKEGINNLPYLFKMAQNTRSIVLQNITLTLLSMIVTVVPTVSGYVPLWLAVLIHEGTTVLTAINSCRLLIK